MIPLPIPLLFLHNFLPIFLYDFIGISMEIVGGMGYGICRWCNGLVVVGIYIYYRRDELAPSSHFRSTPLSASAVSPSRKISEA